MPTAPGGAMRPPTPAAPPRRLLPLPLEHRRRHAARDAHAGTCPRPRHGTCRRHGAQSESRRSRRRARGACAATVRCRDRYRSHGPGWFPAAPFQPAHITRPPHAFDRPRGRGGAFTTRCQPAISTKRANIRGRWRSTASRDAPLGLATIALRTGQDRERRGAVPEGSRVAPARDLRVGATGHAQERPGQLRIRVKNLLSRESDPAARPLCSSRSVRNWRPRGAGPRRSRRLQRLRRRAGKSDHCYNLAVSLDQIHQARPAREHHLRAVRPATGARRRST